MSSNNTIQSLYNLSKFVRCIRQDFQYIIGFGIISAFNNYVVETTNQIIINFSEENSIISNIKINGGKFKLMNKTREITFPIINVNKYKNLKLIIWDFYLIKNNLLSSL